VRPNWPAILGWLGALAFGVAAWYGIIALALWRLGIW